MQAPYLELFTEYLVVERSVSHNTREAYLCDLISFFNALDDKDTLTLETLQATHIQNTLAKIDTQKGLSSRSRARKMSALRSYFKFLLREGILKHNPMQHLEMPKQGRHLPKTISEQEISTLISATLSHDGSPEEIRLYCLLEVLYATGLRVSELISLRFGQVMTALRSEQIPAPMIVVGKGRKERLVLLSKAATEALRTYLEVRPVFLKSTRIRQGESNPWLFPSSASQGYITRQRFGQLLKELALKCGIDLEKISPHIVRHAFASHMLGRGADLISLQALLGHADISTTEIYTHVTSQHLVKTLEKHHPLSKKRKLSKDD